MPDAMFGVGRTEAGRRRTLPVIFTTYSLRTRSAAAKVSSAVRVEHHLGQTVTITDIEENHPTVVTATVNPTAKSNFLAFQAFVQLAAIMAAHHGSGFASRNSKFGRSPWAHPKP